MLSTAKSFMISFVLGVAVAVPAHAGSVCDPNIEICFTGIGDLAGGSFYSDAKGIAHVDGVVVVVGESSSTASQAACNNCREAVRYTVGPLQPLLTGPNIMPSVATDVTLVGTTMFISGGAGNKAMRAQLQGTGQTVPFFLPTAPGGRLPVIGNSISDDGQTIVGNSAPEPLGEGGSCFKWTATGNTIVMPKLAANVFAATNTANGVSPDGSETVGGSSAQTGFVGYLHPAPFTICLPTGCGATSTGDLAGGNIFSEAFGVTNGGVAVGFGTTAAGEEAFRWTPPGFGFPPPPGVMTSLGDFPGGAVLSRAKSITGDGLAIVGFGTSATGQQAFYRHPNLGFRSLQELLVNDFGTTGLSNWTLSVANAISTDGLAIAGQGINPSGQTEGWFVTLPDCDGNGRWDGLDAPLPWVQSTRTVPEFDGTDDFLELATPSPESRITGNLTIEAWVFLHRLGVSQSVVSLGAVGESLATNLLYGIDVDAGGDVVVAHERSDFSDVIFTADTNLQPGRWHHLAITRTMFSQSTLEYSVQIDDQAPSFFGAGGAAAGGTAAALRLGRAPGASPVSPFDGLIGDLRIWNVARTPAQIAASMFTTNPLDSTGLVAHWALDEPTGTTFADAVGSNDLTSIQGGLRQTVAADCNLNRIPDSCELDCNANGIPDDCDLRDITSRDCDADGRPDECSILDVLADLLETDGAATQVFHDERDDPVSPTTFGTMIERYGRPWLPGTGQTPGGGTSTTRDPAERLRMLTKDPSCLPTNVAQKALNELFAFEMLLGNEAFSDAMDPTVGEGALGESISLDEVPGIFAFRGVPGINSLLDEELALLRGREIVLPASANTPLNDDPAANPNGNYPQFGAATRAAIYNRLRPNATTTLGSIGYRSNYGFANTTTDALASEAFPQGHGDSYGYYLTATKAYVDVFGAARETPVPPEFALSLVESLQVPEGSVDCGTLDCAEVMDDDGITHHVGFQSVRNMAAAMSSRARAVNRIVDLTFRRDYREDTDTLLTDSDTARAWGMVDWARRGGVGAYFDWAVLNHLLPVPAVDAEDQIESVHRQRMDEVRLLASSVDEMQERVDAAGAGLNPLGLVPNVVPFRIIQPGQLLNFLQGGSSAGQSHYGIVRNAAVEAIKNARGILMRANNALNRLRGNESAFTDFEDQVRQSDTGLTDRLIEIFGLPSPSDPSDNDGEDNDGDGVQLTAGVNDPDDDFIEAGCDGACAGSPDLRNSLVDTQTQDELGWADRVAVGQVQLAMFELRMAALRAEVAEQALSNLEALIQAKAENVALVRQEAVESLEIRADACAELKNVIDRKEELAKAREQRGFLSRIGGLITSMAACAASSGVAGCGPAIKSSLGFVGEALANLAAGSDPPSGINNEFDASREELRINCWQTASLANISNDQTIRALEIELEDLIRRTPQAILELVVVETQARQAFAIVRKNFQEGLRLVEERERMRRVQTDKLTDFRFRDLAFRTFRNQALEQYGAFFDLAGRYVMLAARAFAYEYNERDEVAAQVQNLYQEQLLGSELGTDEGLESVISRLDQKRQESEFVGRLQKLSLFDNGGDEFSLRKNMLGLAIDPTTDSGVQQFEKNKAFRAFLETHIVQELFDVPAFAQLASVDSDRDAGPALVLTFSTEVAGRTIFGQRRGTTFGAPANFDTCSNPKLFEFAILLEGVDNPSALGVDSQLIFAHFIPVGTSMLRAPESGDCALRTVRSWEVVDQRIPGVSAAYQTPGTTILDSFGIPRLATSPDLNVINRFPVTQAQVRSTESPIFQDDLAGWSVWNTQWLLAIPGRQFADSSDPPDLVRKKLLILIFDADASGNPRSPDQNLGIDDIKLRIKAYGKPS